MTSPSYQVKVPGKLMIAGEYAVLEPGGQAIVVAIDRYIKAVIEPSAQNTLSLPELGLDNVAFETEGHDITFSVSNPKLSFIDNAITTYHRFVLEKSIDLRPFTLTITSELDDSSGKKYGLGSSAAVVVAVIAAMSQLYKSEISQPSTELIYKLSAIAHFKTQGSGSCADVAASVYGGWIHYRAFESSWLMGELKKETAINKMIEQSWPNLLITPITPPTGLRLSVGWTGKEAATAPMIAKINNLRERHPKLYARFLAESEKAVSNLVHSFEEGDCIRAISSLSENRQALMQLSGMAEATIETEKLKQLIRIADKFGSGKTSGAGGGDCGIAFLNGESSVAELYAGWDKEQILPLQLTVSPHQTYD